MSLALRTPSVEFRESYLSGLDELDSDGERSAWVYLGAGAPRDLPHEDFASYVQMLLAREHAPPPGFVPDTVYWAIRDREMVGRISLRHELNDSLLQEGGHTGYIVRP